MTEGPRVAGGVVADDLRLLIRLGFGEPADGVSEQVLSAALARLIEECAPPEGSPLNADQAKRAAYRVREELDATGIAALFPPALLPPALPWP